MFEFDEHFAELEAMEIEEMTSEMQEQNMLPGWCYVGSGVWKLSGDSDALQISHEVHSMTSDIA